MDRDENIGGGEGDPGFGLLGTVLLHEGGLVAVDEFLEGAGFQPALGSLLSYSEADIMAARGALPASISAMASRHHWKRMRPRVSSLTTSCTRTSS